MVDLPDGFLPPTVPMISCSCQQILDSFVHAASEPFSKDATDCRLSPLASLLNSQLQLVISSFHMEYKPNSLIHFFRTTKHHTNQTNEDIFFKTLTISWPCTWFIYRSGHQDKHHDDDKPIKHKKGNFTSRSPRQRFGKKCSPKGWWRRVTNRGLNIGLSKPWGVLTDFWVQQRLFPSEVFPPRMLGFPVVTTTMGLGGSKVTTRRNYPLAWGSC